MPTLINAVVLLPSSRRDLGAASDLARLLETLPLGATATITITLKPEPDGRVRLESRATTNDCNVPPDVRALTTTAADYARLFDQGGVPTGTFLAAEVRDFVTHVRELAACDPRYLDVPLGAPLLAWFNETA
jgi:hypothetical protein